MIREMIALCLVIAGTVLSCGCGGSQTTPALDVSAQQVAVAAFGTEDLRCVTQSVSRAQADTCRKDIHAYWCTHGLSDACGWDGGAP